MSLIKIINFLPLGDKRGSLMSLESKKNVPFEIKRVYYIFNTKVDVSRGFHAHHSIKQVMVCLNGSCRFVLDDGLRRDEVLLDSPHQGLVIDKLTWREMHNFSANCVLLVLASEYYNENDYIRNYEEFLKIVNE